MIYLYGAGGHGKVVAEIAQICGLEFGGFIDDNPEVEELLNFPVFYKQEKILQLKWDNIIISIGDNKIRKSLSEKLTLKYGILIHPNVSVSPSVKIAEGTVVMAGVSINSSTKIGSHVIINTNSSVDHDCVLEDFVHISPNAALAGNVTVKEGTQIGIGACVIEGVIIGKWCTIGAGAVIINDIPDYATVVGNPGKIIKIIEKVM